VSPASEPLLSVRELAKHYPAGTRPAVDRLSFDVAAGEVFGLLGPNGAGKSTTIGMLTTRTHPSSGQVLVGGHDVGRDPVAAKRLIAVVPQARNLDRALTARRILLFHAAYFGVPKAERRRRAEALLTDLGLAERAGEKVDRYSGGMAQRLMIARALMHDPRVLFLDEPTTGLDPQARLFLWNRLADLRGRGLTIVLTTHDMEEAERLADRVAILDRGKLVALDTPKALTALVPGTSTLELTVTGATGALPTDLLAALSALPGVERAAEVASEDPAARLSLAGNGDPAELVAPVGRLLAGHGLGMSGLRLGQATLEDAYIHFTGRALR
jgi:ABC-2 type transport system ATP-binding protein